MNPGITEKLNRLAHNLSKAIVKVLTMHIGRKSAIGRFQLQVAVGNMGFHVTERTLREEIKQLRRDGWLICAMPGEDGGYYLAETLEEFREFDRLEFGAKIADMNETRQALLKAARECFGDAAQPGLL